MSSCSLVRTVQQMDSSGTCHFLVMKVNRILRPVISWLMLIVGRIGRRRQKYFSIHGKKGEVLSGWEGTSVLASPPANVSCRWPLASLSKQFHWRENFLVNGLGHFLGVETTSLCGPGFEVMKATVGGGTR